MVIISYNNKMYKTCQVDTYIPLSDLFLSLRFLVSCFFLLFFLLFDSLPVTYIHILITKNVTAVECF